MKNNYEFIEELKVDFKERNNFLKKYYPYFKLIMDKNMVFDESRIGNNRLENVDVGYVILSTLRFLMEENNFNNRGVTYHSLCEFLKKLLDETYRIILDRDEITVVGSTVLELLTNYGQPYEFSYMEPITKQKVTHRISYLRAEIDSMLGSMVYYITDAGVEFYLETKEMKEMNKISIQQVLLEKMVSSSNFKGAKEVVSRISNEVAKLYLLKNEVLNLIRINPLEGERLYKEFYTKCMEWFNQEEDYFTRNLANLDYVREQMKLTENVVGLHSINELGDELKLASNKYSALLSEIMDLKNKVDEVRSQRKIKVLKNTFDYNQIVSRLLREDNVTGLEYLIQPLLDTKKYKFFDFKRIDDLLKFKASEEEEIEVVKEEQVESFLFEDEIELERIQYHHNLYIHCLFTMLKEIEAFDLKEYNKYLSIHLSEKVFNNGDYYSFLIALSGRTRYVKEEANEDSGSLYQSLLVYEKKTGEFIPFEIEFRQEEIITLRAGFQTTNIYVRRLSS